MSTREGFDWSHIEVLHNAKDIVQEELKLLLEPEKAWQPTDYLPDMTAANWRDQLEAFRNPAMEVSDEILVVLVGDMVTEEALPSYSMSLNMIVQDYAGDDQGPWAKWLRGWTAEENRHGDLLNAYLRLTGRVDMRSIELTIHNLLTTGFNAGWYPDPYGGIVYTSFQERATKVSHANVGKLAAKAGDPSLGKICARIAGDEARHEAFYSRVMGRVFELDPNGAMLAFRNMMRGLIAMPGRLMYDGKDPDLFDHFAVVAQKLNVYTVHDYADIIAHLVTYWDIPHRQCTDKAAKAQDWLCRQAERYRNIADMMAADIQSKPPAAFSWIHGRKA